MVDFQDYNTVLKCNINSFRIETMISNHFTSAFRNAHIGSSTSDCIKEILDIAPAAHQDMFEEDPDLITTCFNGHNKYKNLDSLLDDDKVFEPQEKPLIDKLFTDIFSLRDSNNSVSQDKLQDLAVKGPEPNLISNCDDTKENAKMSATSPSKVSNMETMKHSDLTNKNLYLNTVPPKDTLNFEQSNESGMWNSGTEAALFTVQNDNTPARTNKVCEDDDTKFQDFEENSDIVPLKNIRTDKEEKSRHQIELLLKKLPYLNLLFDISSKIGEGSFSTVFLGKLKNMPEGAEERKFAIKHLIPTILPARAERELRCMQDMGGKDNVVGVDLCLRQEEAVVFIMPYLPHKRFSEYVLDLGVDEVRNYMKNLLLALRRVHSFNIIHRDVKPSNFLYDRENNKFLLIDFGLSQPACVEDELNVPRKRKLDSLEIAGVTLPLNDSQKRIALYPRSNSESNISPVKPKHSSTPLEIKRRPSILKKAFNAHKSPRNSSKNLETENTPPRKKGSPSVTKDKIARSRSAGILSGSIRKKLFEENKLNSSVYSNSPRSLSSTPLPSQKFQTLLPCNSPLTSSGSSFVRVQDSQVKSHVPYLMGPKESQSKKSLFCKPAPVSPAYPSCLCFGKPQVCSVCVKKKKLIAPRAGTPGFRPPEVLLKCTHQTTAVDMWAAGVVFLCILAGCYPFFRSPDDLTALTEIMVVFGSENVKRVAFKLGRSLQCSEEKKPLCLRKLCQRIRRKRKQDKKDTPADCPKCPDCLQGIEIDGCLCPGNDSSNVSSVDDDKFSFPSSAFDLLHRLLDLDPNTRITAEEALNHPFILGL